MENDRSDCSYENSKITQDFVAVMSSGLSFKPVSGFKHDLTDVLKESLIPLCRIDWGKKE